MVKERKKSGQEIKTPYIVGNLQIDDLRTAENLTQLLLLLVVDPVDFSPIFVHCIFWDPNLNTN